MDAKRFFWLIEMYNSKFNKIGGVLSDYESFLGYNKQNKVIRDFLRELIEMDILILDEYVRYKNLNFPKFKINRKKLFELIKKQEWYFKNLMRMVNEEYMVIGDLEDYNLDKIKRI